MSEKTLHINFIRITIKSSEFAERTIAHTKSRLLFLVIKSFVSSESLDLRKFRVFN